MRTCRFAAMQSPVTSSIDRMSDLKKVVGLHSATPNPLHHITHATSERAHEALRNAAFDQRTPWTEATAVTSYSA